MKITIAKNAGFCFGVKRAIQIVEELLKKGKSVCIMGNIINNPQVIKDLENRGARTISSLSEVSCADTLVIRSHGIKKELLEEIKARSIKYIDATCPFVKKVQTIVEKNSENKKILLVAGTPIHPEVVGIRSYFLGKSYVFSDLDTLKRIMNENNNSDFSGIMVSQTTFSVEKWKKCVEFIKKHFTNIDIYDTICYVTNLRQSEVKKLSETHELIIVVGGYSSSNTNKLKEVCLKNANVIHIERVEELSNYNLENFGSVALVAGASTPTFALKEVEAYFKSRK